MPSAEKGLGCLVAGVCLGLAGAADLVSAVCRACAAAVIVSSRSRALRLASARAAVTCSSARAEGDLRAGVGAQLVELGGRGAGGVGGLPGGGLGGGGVGAGGGEGLGEGVCFLAGLAGLRGGGDGGGLGAAGLLRLRRSGRDGAGSRLAACSRAARTRTAACLMRVSRAAAGSVSPTGTAAGAGMRASLW